MTVVHSLGVGVALPLTAHRADRHAYRAGNGTGREFLLEHHTYCVSLLRGYYYCPLTFGEDTNLGLILYVGIFRTAGIWSADKSARP